MPAAGPEDRPLFNAFPRMRATVSHVALGLFPTPVQRLANVERLLGETAPVLYVKRDDLSGELYGGNKVRKLEFLLGCAHAEKRREVLTFGAAGSNHALATALYARQLGIGCVSMLVPQPNAASVRRNLLLGHGAGAELHHCNTYVAAAGATLVQLGLHWLRTRRFPYLIPPGGSSPVGLAGFVNAAFELKEQVAAGAMPEPDILYAASGTMGTVVGLALGLGAAGLKTKVMAVRVTDPQYTSIPKARRLFERTKRLLRAADPAFPDCAFPVSFEFRHDFFGNAYGLYTGEAMRAVERMREAEGIRLEGTYTGKAFAALLADAEAGKLRGKTVLFWNTYNAREAADDFTKMDYRVLPTPLHRYFEQDVQPLDR